MVITFGRHRHDLPADQLDPLVLVENAGLYHRLKLGHGEAPPRQPFRRLRRKVRCSSAQIHVCHGGIVAKVPGTAKQQMFKGVA